MIVTVCYWRGTTQYSEKVGSYQEAMEVAGRSENAFPPTFYDEDGRKLYDDGQGLCYEGRDVYAT
jgi:hypothetical protein